MNIKRRSLTVLFALAYYFYSQTTDKRFKNAPLLKRPGESGERPAFPNKKADTNHSYA